MIAGIPGYAGPTCITGRLRICRRGPLYCKTEEAEAIRLALRHKADLARMVAAADQGGLELVQGASVGAVWLLSQLACDLGIVAALGSDRQGKLALWQVIARVLDQGSRLSAVWRVATPPARRSA